MELNTEDYIGNWNFFFLELSLRIDGLIYFFFLFKVYVVSFIAKYSSEIFQSTLCLKNYKETLRNKCKFPVYSIYVFIYKHVFSFSA